MNVSAPFIARPIATALLAIAVLISGILGYMELPVSSLPEVEFPTIEVTTQLPGAGPNTIASLITAPLERQLGEIQGVVGMTSTSAQGLSQIIMQFSLDRDIDDAAQDVQAAINASAGTLADIAALSADLCQGEPGGYADRHPRDDLEVHSALYDGG